MWTRAIIFALGLAICGTYGCAPVVVSSARNFHAPQQLQSSTNFHAPQPKQSSKSSATVLSQPATETPLAESTFALVEAQQPEFLPAVSLPVIELPPRSSDEKTEGPEIREKPAKTQNVPPSVSQRASRPRADDHLLELLEKDLKKAVEQTVERRRLQFSRAVVQNARVRHFINTYSKNQKEHFAKALARSGRYFPMIAKTLHEEGLPEELAYLALIESEFSPQASSPAGAVGLWQFVPSTARKYGLKMDSWVDERRDPIKATRAAAAHLKELHGYFGRWYLATAAYNGGQGAVNRAMQSVGTKDFSALTETANLSDETRNFVPRFVAAALIATDPKKYGFGDVIYEMPLEYEEVEVHGYLQLASVAEIAGADVQSVKELNPALLRGHTPPGEDSYLVKVPAGHAQIFAQAYQRSRDTHSPQMVTHEVQRGETLFSIARRYGQKARSLMELNGLTDSRLRVGQKLMVILTGLRGTLR
jgi:soluble lytic murein transglycosylase-like protein